MIEEQTVVKLYDSNKLVIKDSILNIVSYLYNNNLIELGNWFWIKDNRRNKYVKNYKYVCENINSLTKGRFRIEVGNES